MSQPTLFCKTRVIGLDCMLNVDVVFPVAGPLTGDPRREVLALVRQEFMRVLPDLKSSHPFLCQYCGNRAHEEFLGFGAWTHLPPKGQLMPDGKVSSGPFALAYFYAVCEMGSPCGREAQKDANDLASYSAVPRDRRMLTTRPQRSTGQPPFGSCAKCHGPHEYSSLRLCSRCKITSVVTCKWIKGARMDKEDGTSNVWKVNPDPYPELA
ncbi:hypothetical protein EWM64_g4063 [Hericium alpestre]|uniref:MYND-type domain-containing protein n=1 Tax=Hericium alpestre TaxID=135208 RepID=A0A4Z0A0T5_9AGAM|nr:hypothetical protein EWM64_g4063 [Hericium alpestre]